MALIKKALIKLDNFNETGSTGGEVIDVFFWDKEQISKTEFSMPQKYQQNYKGNDTVVEWYVGKNSNYIIVNCQNECKIGWIYTSKTNILVDSNKPPK